MADDESGEVVPCEDIDLTDDELDTGAEPVDEDEDVPPEFDEASDEPQDEEV